MTNRQKRRAQFRKLPMGYYHLCTDGRPEVLLFHTQEQFAHGMTTIALAALKFEVKIYIFELMPNHLHIELSASGETCVAIFDFVIHRISKQLMEDGDPPLPDDYDFRLTEIKDQDSFVDHYLYVARNPYEKGWCVPGGYRWGSDYLLFNQWTDLITGTPVGGMTYREKRQALKSEIDVPAHWEYHPQLGLLPKNFVSLEKVKALIPNPKRYLTRLTKDYERLVHISSQLGEDVVFSSEELEDLVAQVVSKLFPQKRLRDLTGEEKCRLVVVLSERYCLSADTIAQQLSLPIRIVYQTLQSKDLGLRKKR